MACGSKSWWYISPTSSDILCSDNNEFFTRNDQLLCKNEFDFEREVSWRDPSLLSGKIRTGVMGRITGTEIMNKLR